jgi:hypothetical protein
LAQLEGEEKHKNRGRVYYIPLRYYRIKVNWYGFHCKLLKIAKSKSRELHGGTSLSLNTSIIQNMADLLIIL